MDDLSRADYEALRATIRERGSVRMWVILFGLAAWGALASGLWAAGAERAVTLVPLLILAATFEISFFIHTGVERAGRYIQVFCEEHSPGWETTVMNYGRSFPGGADPLFITLFSIIAAINFLTSLTTSTRRPGWVAISLVAHLILGWRFSIARRLAANQRTVDLERFRTLKNSPISN
jgi:hypothetical protein